MQVVNMFTEYFKLCPSRAMNEPREITGKKTGVKHYKLHADTETAEAMQT